MCLRNSNDNADELDSICIWCGVSKRFFPEYDMQWAVLDEIQHEGICTACWNALPEQERKLLSSDGSDDSNLAGVEP
ncbi:MAG: hypothetical protein KZQ82_20100 [Candidatus Thiodiazotropha sp. (ex Lucinoma annulata)]|nr:hypothetical protein [Candidatus Thiodiazotropha sp. (ex Lucinoma annulata)]